MKKQLLLLYCILFWSVFGFSQKNTSVSLEFLEKNKSPVVGATVKVTDRDDSTAVRFASTDSAGRAVFTLMSGVQYLVDANFVGMKPLQKGLKVNENKRLYGFVMEEDATLLEGVTIKARKPLMRQEEDKTIVDPEPIVGASTNAYELMEKIPGLFLDQDGNVYLSSATPATIYINGREQKMSASDVATMLKSLPPNSIERIEILRTPSAKYDASGGGGIVNVVLKKGVKIGLTGSVNVGMNQGRYGNQNAGISLNNSVGNRMSYLNLNYARRDGYDQLLTLRDIRADSVLRQGAYSRMPGQVFYTGYGYNVSLRDKFEFGLDGRASIGSSDTRTRTSNRLSQGSETLNDNLNDLHNDAMTISVNQGLSAKYKIDSAGSELTADLSYSFFQNQTVQDFTLSAQQPSGGPDIGGLGDIQSGRHNFAATLDFKYLFPYKISLETGLKTTLTRFQNETDYSILVDGTSSPDPFRTNTFDFEEGIHAAYAQASKGFAGFILKAGTRLENTNMIGRQRIPSDTSFAIHRTDFFPYVYLSHRVAKIAGYELRGYLVYRRFINRPVYEYLNPFPRFLDQYFYEAGNPSLRPQFTQKYEFNISFEDMPIFAVGRNYTQDIFTNVVYQDPSLPSVTYRTYDNLGKNEESYFRITGAMPPGGKYFFVLGAQYALNRYDGLYENRPLTFSRGSWFLFTYHQLKLGDLSMFTLNAFLRLRGQAQFYELGDFGGVSLTVNRQFFNRKLVVTLSLNDLLYTNRNTFSLNQGNVQATGDRRSDTRRVGLQLRYNFGLRKRQEEQGFNLNVPEE